MQAGYAIFNIEITNPEDYKEYVIKFPSYEKALEWYNSEEYQPIKQIRLVNANTNGIIIQGA